MVGLDRSPSPGSQACTGWGHLPSLALLLYKQKNFRHRSVCHVNVCCCGNIYYIFGHVQKLMFVIVNFSVMFTNFGHILLIMWITLIFSCLQINIYILLIIFSPNLVSSFYLSSMKIAVNNVLSNGHKPEVKNQIFPFLLFCCCWLAT